MLWSVLLSLVSVATPPTDLESAWKLGGSGLHAEAAVAYLDFAATHPVDVRSVEALYNAGYHFDRANDDEQAMAVWWQFASMYPDDARSWPLLLRMASHHTDATNLDKAITAYEQIIQSADADYPDLPSAHFNAAFLRGRTGDHQGAALGYERYTALFPALPDAASVSFAAGEHWEQVSDQAALDFYDRHLKRWADVVPDNTLQARYRRAVISDTAAPTEAAAAWDALASSDITHASPMARQMVGWAEIRALEADLEAFGVMEITNDDNRNATILMVEKSEELVALEGRARALVVRYGDPAITTAAIHLSASGYFAYADLMNTAPVPASLDEHETELYREAIAERAIPIADKGVQRLERAIAMAREVGIWTEWSARSEATLQAHTAPVEL